MNKTALSFLLTFFLISIPYAQEPKRDSIGKPYGPSFANLDGDRDGFITYQEYLSWHESSIKKRFSFLDKDNDQILSEEEYSAPFKEREVRMRRYFLDEKPLR